MSAIHFNTLKNYLLYSIVFVFNVYRFFFRELRFLWRFFSAFNESKNSHLKYVFFDRMNVKWIDLAKIDDLLTRRFVDSEKNINHEITVEVTQDMPTRFELEKSELYQKVEKSYEMLKNIVDLKSLWGNYSRDSCLVSYGVFAKNLLPAVCRIPFLFGFLAPMNVADKKDGEKEFSIFDLSNSEKLLMLGPASFINSSCRNNSFYDPQPNESLLYIKVGAKSILPGQEKTVLYSGCYFGPNRIKFQCPHMEFHGADPYVFAT